MAIAIKQFNARVGQLTKSNTKFKNEVQELLCIAAQYAFDDKNVDPLTNLVMRDGTFRFDGIDNKVLIHWIEAHIPARWDNKESKFRFNKSFNAVYDAVVLLSEPWWKKQVTPSQVTSSIDLLAEVRSFIERLEKQASKKVIIDDKEVAMKVEHAEILAALKAVANDAQYTKEA